MASETKLDIISESPKKSPKLLSPLDHENVEMVFGKPKSPKVEPAIHATAEKDNHKDPQPDHKESEGVHASQPLLEQPREKQQPPLAGPEIDDLDTPAAHAPYPGIDDGLLEPSDKKGPDADADQHKDPHSEPEGHDEGKWLWPSGDDVPDYPDGIHGFSNGLEPRFGVDRPGSPYLPPGSIPDVNTYQQKKNLAQGMMDLALLSANANQLRYVLESSAMHPYFYPSVVFISLSIILQIAVGIGLIMNSRYDVKDEKDICKADKINNMTVLGVFLVTIVNVFITSFSVATPTSGTSVAVNGG